MNSIAAQDFKLLQLAEKCAAAKNNNFSVYDIRYPVQVMGNEYDSEKQPHSASYESIEQLLTALSPAYRKTFSDSLSFKLEKLSDP